MPRLRHTVACSLLALFAGIAGTGWLSGQTAGWSGPPAAVQPRTVPRRQPSHREAGTIRRPAPVSRPAVVALVPVAPTAEPRLVPLSMPADPTPYVALRGHLDGHVSLHVNLDAQGLVRDAAVGDSSGDPVLDAHALATVRRWRFAVPPGHPHGIAGDLSMRFDSGSRLARTP
jgi:periplasmic protein TonB